MDTDEELTCPQLQEGNSHYFCGMISSTENDFMQSQPCLLRNALNGEDLFKYHLAMPLFAMLKFVISGF